MNTSFDDLFNEFKKLSDSEKKQAIIDFLKNNIIVLQNLNKQINNNLDSNDINTIVNESVEDHLDVIYQLLHLMTEQIEMFSEKVANDFFE